MEGVREPSAGTQKSLPFDRLFLRLFPPKQISLRQFLVSIQPYYHASFDSIN